MQLPLTCIGINTSPNPKGVYIVDAEGERIGSIYGDSALTNADALVAAVNERAADKAEIERLREALLVLYDDDRIERLQYDMIKFEVYRARIVFDEAFPEVRTALNAGKEPRTQVRLTDGPIRAYQCVEHGATRYVLLSVEAMARFEADWAEAREIIAASRGDAEYGGDGR
jgi:hypothetical protein